MLQNLVTLCPCYKKIIGRIFSYLKLRFSHKPESWDRGGCVVNEMLLFYLCVHVTIYNHILSLPCCLLMLFTVGLCGLRSALCYICLLRTRASSSFPPVILLSFLHPSSLGPSHTPPSFCWSFPLTSACLLFFLYRFCPVHLTLKLIQPGKLYERAEKHKTWLWPDVRITSCIIQIIR